MRKLHLLLLSATVLALSACASGPTLAPKGAFQSGQASVVLDRDWSDTSTVFNSRTPKVKLLTIDGVGLNRLYVSDGLDPSEPLMIGPNGDTKDKPAPRGSKNMSLTEQVEFVTQSVAEQGYLKVEYQKPKPVTIGTAKGVRFEMTMRTTDGLDMRGLGQAVTHKGKSYYIVYLAPAEHFYETYLPNALAAMDSVTLPK